MISEQPKTLLYPFNEKSSDTEQTFVQHTITGNILQIKKHLFWLLGSYNCGLLGTY